MAIRYSVVKRKANIKGNKKDIYVADIRRDQGIQTDELCHMIEKRTALTKSDVRSVLENLGDIVAESVGNGRSIYLERLGIFSVNVKSKASDTKNAFKPENLKGIKLNFRPTTQLKNAMQRVSFNCVKEDDTCPANLGVQP